MADTGANDTAASFTEAEGQEYILSLFDFVNAWDASDLTIEKIEKFKDHWFTDKVRENIKGMVIQGDPIINILDPNGNSREDLASWIRTMANNLNMLEKMVKMFDDLLTYGNIFASKGIQNLDGKIEYSEVRLLPPPTFAFPGNYASTLTINQAYGRIFKGINRDQDGVIHYWQTQNGLGTGLPVELKNCSHIISPKSTYHLDGVPVLNPLYQLLPKLDDGMSGLGQAGNRANVVFIRDNRANGGLMPNGITKRWDYLKGVLRKFSRNLFFPLAAEMEPIELKGPVSDIHVQAINLITKLIISVYSPSDFLSMGEGNRLGGSTAGETTLVKSFVKSQHRIIVSPWENWFEFILEANYFKGFKCQIMMPEIEEDNRQLDFQIGQELLAAIKAGIIIAEINEVREKFHMEDISPEALEEAKKLWEKALINIAKGTMPEPSSNPSKEPNKSGDSEELDDQELLDGLKENQGNIPTIEEIQAEAERQLNAAVATCFEKLGKIRSR